MSFPPSSADFQRPIFDVIISPLLDFLEEGNSSLLLNIYPCHVYRIKTEIPISYVIFQEHPFNFRDDVFTGVRYRNLFDVMVDSVVASLAISGHESIPLIVTETGWPSSVLSSSHVSNNLGVAEATNAYAELYLRGLTDYLKYGMGTPLKKEAMSEVYNYQLFDGGESMAATNGSSNSLLQWGFMYPNLMMKFHVDFSGSQRILWNRGIFLLLLMMLPSWWFFGYF